MRKSMYKKLVGIVVLGLLIATALPVLGTINNEHYYNNIKSSSASTIAWSDDFDSYATGSLLHGQGGWEAWDLVIENSPYVRDEQSRSAPNSVELTWVDGVNWSDIVHIFYGVDSGQWTITAWWFLPEDFFGYSGFVLLNKYEHNDTHQLNEDVSLQVLANSYSNTIKDLWSGGSLPLVRNEWVEIRIEIDFEMDTYDVYYNSTLLGSESWTRGVGQKKLACIDLCNDGSVSNATYFDDISLEGDVSENADLYCKGDLKWLEVKPGATVVGSFILQNSGAAGTLLDWEIESTPDWGEWSFDPNGGTDLVSYYPVIVNVEVVAPNKPNKNLTGELKIVNSENPDDYEIIDVILSTPRNKPVYSSLILRLFERFPLLEKLLTLIKVI